MIEPYFETEFGTLYHGKSEIILPSLPDNSMDSIVTDPPYGLKFMGKKWDYKIPSVEVWRECLRVLKPGGFLLSFAGTRTQHRMACNIEDAGFEIRDMIAWVYSQGFPKSLDIGKAIDKLQGNEREVIGTKKTKDIRRSVAKDIEMGKTDRQGKFAPGSPTKYMEHTETKGNSPHEGWGTALKPAWENIGIYQKPISALEPVMSNRATERIKPALEPITVARKPFPGTVAANVLEWGTGGINIDGCRVENEAMTEGRAKQNTEGRYAWNTGDDTTKPLDNPEQHIGRFPANLIHDGSPEVLGLFPETKSGSMHGIYKNTIMKGRPGIRDGNKIILHQESSSGSAARFFYCAKASKQDRGRDNTHPTVKPTDLIRYLCRLVTPPGGTVLDPFFGSGTMGPAAYEEGFKFVGIEMGLDNCEIAAKRIERETKQLKLF